MSEDEAVKILRDIPFLEHVENNDVNGPKWILKTNKRLAQARDMVLDLYKKEKEKNKELTDFIEAIDELKQAKKPITDLVYEMNKFEDEFISKDKIKVKIEKLKKLYDESKGLQGNVNILYHIGYLKEILEEE